MGNENRKFNQLWNFFGGKVSHKSSKLGLEIPVVKQLDGKKGDKYKHKLTFDKAPSRMEELWNYFLTQCHDNNESFKSMQEVYADMDYMYFNSTIYSRSVELYADEIVQQDSKKIY